MSNTAKLQEEFVAVRNDLLSAAVICKDRAQLGRVNAEKIKTISTQLQNYEATLEDLTGCLNYITKLYKNIEQYLVDKKETSLEALRIAIEKAGMIVPDADVSGIDLEIKDKKARVVTKKGQDINLREGSAYRTILGSLMVYALIKVQPNAAQFILYDETFSTLSDTTAAIMREFIDVIKEDMLIIGIEQRNILYDGIERTTYEVSKGEDKVTTVRRWS